MAQKLSREEFFKLNEELINSNESDYVYIEYSLLSHDLSDIPFEDWKKSGIRYDSKFIKDFSRTHANIDFSIIDFSGKANFKGCNIRHLEKLKGNIKPEYFDEKTIKENSEIFLSNNIPKEIQNKIYKGVLSITDINTLPKEQIKEISTKIDLLTETLGYEHDEENIIYSILYKAIGLEKMVEFYNSYKNEYKAVTTILNHNYLGWSIGIYRYFIKKIKEAKEIDKIKDTCFEILKEIIIKRHDFKFFKPEEFEPELFVQENKEFFLIDKNIPNDVKERYYNRCLTIHDVVDYYEELKNIPLDNFISYDDTIDHITTVYNLGEYQKLINKYPLAFKYLSSKNHIISVEFDFDFSRNLSLEDNFLEAMKKYILKHKLLDSYYSIHMDGTIKYKNLSKWIESLNFDYYKELKYAPLLTSYTSKTFIVDSVEQRILIEIFGINNLKRLEKETGIFSIRGYGLYKAENVFKIVKDFIYKRLADNYILEFQYGKLPYDEFEEKFVNLLDYIRSFGKFTTSDFFESVNENFKNKYPRLFIDKKAPIELKNKFYFGKIRPEFLFQKDYMIPYLVDKNLINTIDVKIYFYGESKNKVVDFVPKYIEKYGNEKFLKLLVKYGEILDEVRIDATIEEFDDEELLNKAIMESIKKHILNNNKSSDFSYSYLEKVPDFYAAYPELFVDFSDLDPNKRLSGFYYSGNFSYDYIRKYPELKELLKDKNLDIPFGREGGRKKTFGFDKDDLLLKDVYGNECFLELCYRYGTYLKDVVKYIDFRDGQFRTKLGTPMDFNAICKAIEFIIAKRCKAGGVNYNELDAPDFLKKNYPKLFLDDDAPSELKSYYYRTNKKIDFKTLQEHKEWIPYLKGKLISPALIRDSYSQHEMIEYFSYFGEEKGLILGIKKPETVTKAIDTCRVYEMEKWYEKTGKKFIPDYVIIKNFPIEEADKFLSNTTSWNKLMKIKYFSKDFESKDALLKLAYSFGIFEGDKRGFNRLYDMLTRIPKKVEKDLEWIIPNMNVYLTNFITLDIDDNAESIISKIEKVDETEFYTVGFTKENLIDLVKSLSEENINIDYNDEIMTQIYKKNEDGSRYLSINPQSYPKTTQTIRSFLTHTNFLKLLTSEDAHRLFGGFKMQYDPEFREFLLDNLDQIIKDDEYGTYISNIQKQFKDIKIANSNRKLTLDLAISYVQQNKYTDIEAGNERVAEVSAVAGYSQEDFDKLQKVYDYGKMRVFSSIPRIENETDKYYYEILRLDDPLALAIGTLTDCCQEIGNVAESCMEHSMVDKNGRVFVVRDKEGNIVSQSWVWRNKDVLCFDNIEIPRKAFDRADDRNKFTEEVYEIYKKVADELIKKDEKVYKKLLEDGKITEEQYEGLRLSKVTVGIGYNDIANAIKRNSKLDYKISTPTTFIEKAGLDKTLYTNDSATQYILEYRPKEKEYNGETIQVYNDAYQIYDNSNFTEKELFRLSKLEIEKDGYSNIMDETYGVGEQIVSAIANYYNLDEENTRIILSANFSIIYEERENEIVIGDIFYNALKDIENSENIVAMQIRLALKQIGKDKKINISNLDKDYIKPIFNESLDLDKMLDIERGLKNS